MSTTVSATELKPGDVFAMPFGSIGVANELRRVIAVSAKHYSATYAQVEHVSLEGAVRGTSNFLAGVELERMEYVDIDDEGEFASATPITDLGREVYRQLEACEDGAYIRVYRVNGGAGVWL